MGRRSGAKRGSRTPGWLRAAFVSLGLVAGVLVAAGAWAYVQLRASLPALDGKVAAPALSAPVTVARDAQGVPTLTGRTRADLAWALGYLHGQERLFQMDGQRRSAAGELSDLVGRAALRRDRTVRLHRFRHRAAAVLAAMTSDERRMLDAYVAGVNHGLGDLEAVPFEYLLLRAQPEPWTAEDTVLTGFAMYVSLQEADGLSERRRGAAREVLGQPLADFLFPEGTSWDAPLDGSSLPTAALPVTGLKRAAMPSAEASAVESGASGSNGFVVGGGISTRGSAIVANDLHLGLRVPNIWYRARLVLEDGSGHPTLDITGITLPGAPTIVAGSNGRVAWGFTNSYVDTSDVVVLEPVDGNPNQYRTPDGPMELSRTQEGLCRICRKPEALMVEESIWGPVIGTDPHGRKLVYRWIAHDPAAVNLRGALELEQAGSVSEA